MSSLTDYLKDQEEKLQKRRTCLKLYKQQSRADPNYKEREKELGTQSKRKLREQAMMLMVVASNTDCQLKGQRYQTS